MSESRERVIEAASQLFHGGSFHKVGIAEICAQARVNKGTFYHFFPSKIDLLIEVINRYADGVAASFTAVASSDAAPARKIMDVFSVPQSSNRAWKASHGVSPGCFIGNMILELGATEPLVRERTEWAINEMTRKLHPVVAEFMKAEKIDGCDVPRAADMLMGLIQGAQVQAKAHNDPELFTRFAVLAPSMIRGAGSELTGMNRA